MAFPILFTEGAGNPTNWSTIRSISGSDIETFAAKLKHSVTFAKKIEGKWHY